MGDLDDDDDVPLWVSQDFSALVKDAPPEVLVIALDLIHIYGMETGGTFVYDPERLVEALRPRWQQRPDAMITAERLIALKPYLQKVFVELPDGTWSLSDK